MKSRQPFQRQRRAVFISLISGFLLLPAAVSRAEVFGDIFASADSIYTGNTYHGYAETRVVLENHSPGRTHSVTLVYPNNSFGSFGNTIARMSRTVKVAPASRIVVSLLQPPLPSQGDGQIRVDVDGHDDNNYIAAPNANNHCSYYTRGGQIAAVFVSRSLDNDVIGRLLNAGRAGYTAEMATGPPDARGGGYDPNCWMPDSRYNRRTNWLELDYASPQTATTIDIYENMSSQLGQLSVIGTSGKAIATLPGFAGKRSGSTTGGTLLEFSLPATKEPVKTVRLDFGLTSPYSVAIDAVQLSGPSGSQWASDARASSDNSAAGPSFSGRTADTVENLRAEVPASGWSEDWLAYTPFEAVAMASSDLDSMSPTVMDALENYMQAGGTILLFGQNGPPAAWHPLKKSNLRDGAEFDFGFGHCFVFPFENPSSLDHNSTLTLRTAVKRASSYWQNLPADDNSANEAFPVVANLKIPTRGFVLLMLGFVVVIGPVNMIYLHRSNRRIWLLWTVPVISIMTTLLVFGYSLLREGVMPDARISGITVLDQVTHRSATVGATAFYCPLTPSGGLSFDFETEATPLVPVGYDVPGGRPAMWIGPTRKIFSAAGFPRACRLISICARRTPAVNAFNSWKNLENGRSSTAWGRQSKRFGSRTRLVKFMARE